MAHNPRLQAVKKKTAKRDNGGKAVNGRDQCMVDPAGGMDRSGRGVCGSSNAVCGKKWGKWGRMSEARRKHSIARMRRRITESRLGQMWMQAQTAWPEMTGFVIFTAGMTCDTIMMDIAGAVERSAGSGRQKPSFFIAWRWKMFEIRDRVIRLSRGDTGMIAFAVEGVALTSNDRAVFTVGRGSTKVMQKVISPIDGRFCVLLSNAETDGLRAGMYEWDLRIVLDAQIDSSGAVRDGREVITPWPPSRLEVVKVVGEV